MSASINSLNKSIAQLEQITGITKQTTKSIGSNKLCLHIETRAGIRVNATIDTTHGLINGSYLISQLIHTDKSIVDKRIARWMRTKEGLWTIDMLKNNSAPWNESLVYEFNQNPIWDYDIDDFDDSRVYKQEFTQAVLNANLYDSKTNYFNLKPLDKNNTDFLFYIVNDRYSNEQFDCYCCHEILNSLFSRFNVWVDDDLEHLVNYIYAQSMKQIWLSTISSHDKEKEDLEFYVSSSGTIEYKTIEQAGHWHSIETRGLEPVYENKYSVWSNVLGYKPPTAPDNAPLIEAKLVESDKSIDANYYYRNTAIDNEQQ